MSMREEATVLIVGESVVKIIRLFVLYTFLIYADESDCHYFFISFWSLGGTLGGADAGSGGGDRLGGFGMALRRVVNGADPLRPARDIMLQRGRVGTLLGIDDRFLRGMGGGLSPREDMDDRRGGMRGGGGVDRRPIMACSESRFWC